MEEKKSHIMQLVSGLFMRYGLRSVTMDDIARELGISKKTLYVHFKDKNDMVIKILNAIIESHKSVIKEVLGMELNAIDEKFEIVKRVGREISGIQPSVFFDLKKYYPDAWKVYEDFKNEFIHDVVVNNLVKGTSEGLYRNDLNQDIIAIHYTNMINMVFDSEIYPCRNHDFKDVYVELFRYHIRGIASRKGIEYLEKKAQELQYKS